MGLLIILHYFYSLYSIISTLHTLLCYYPPFNNHITLIIITTLFIKHITYYTSLSADVGIDMILDLQIESDKCLNGQMNKIFGLFYY